jgi:ribosomal protein S18 acetylase RimI-like enzyme
LNIGRSALEITIEPFNYERDRSLALEAERVAWIDAGYGVPVEEKVKKRVRAMIDQAKAGDYWIFTAVLGDVPVALLCIDKFKTTPETLYIDNLYVAPGQRSMGIGKRLMEAAVALARQRHSGAVELTVTSANEAALHLYRQLGFKITRHRMAMKIESDPVK